MKPTLYAPLLCIAILAISCVTGFAESSAPASVVGHQTKEIEGWTLLISDALVERDQAAHDKALELLTEQLREIIRVVPEPAVKQLQQVPLWFSPEYVGIQPRAEYHPGAGWLRENNRDPAMAKAVEFTNIGIFERETKRMPNFALHELAHAFHDRVLVGGFRNEEVVEAFERAKSRALYEKVEQRFGDGRSAEVRAYAMTSPMEYFAECTEAYFSTNDFFPFTREELQVHDPEMFTLVKKLWGDEEAASDKAMPVDDGTNRSLSVERIFASDDFRGDRTPPVQWLPSGGYTTLLPSEKNPRHTDIVRVDDAGEKEVLVTASQLVPSGSQDPLSIQGYEFSKDLDVVLIFTNSVRVWRQNTRGDYWAFRRSTGEILKIGAHAEPSSLMFAKLSPDGGRVGYVQANNLFVQSLAGDDVKQLTTDGSEEVINGTFDWVYEEEFFCRDGWRWSPDGKRIAFWQLNTNGVKKFTLVDNTTQNYPILKSFAYPKTGEQNSACRIGVIDAEGGAAKWLDIPGDTRTDFYLPRMSWTDNTNELVIQRINRLQNAVNVMLADASTGATRTVMTERDGAWVDIHDDAMTWLEDGKSFVWISERDGWRQPYKVSRDGSSQTRMLNVDFDVMQMLHVDEAAGLFYFLASPDNPTQQYLYIAPLDGSAAPRRLSPLDQAGTHEYSISPVGKFAVHTYSTFETPARTEIISLPEHKVVQTLSTNESLAKTIAALSKTPAEFFRVEVGNGVELDGWLLKPAGFDEGKKYPLIVHVYGEPASQSVKDRWSGQNYLWHLMMAQQGYAVACIDNRGTPCPRGREWRKAAYRRVGTLASEDQAAATRELLKRPYLDASRVGAWGWSGGGSMTLNLLFRYPELFQTGVAIASVPDMRLYDTIYQERYMGLPQQNAEDYRQGSPITHAAGLRGNLLIVHGSGDDNCHAQGMERLTNRLIELNKPFTQMSYPNRSHSINEGVNTSLHLYGLMTRYFKDHLPPGSKQVSE
jgi:dipeptidyl-peptidase 4